MPETLLIDFEEKDILDGDRRIANIVLEVVHPLGEIRLALAPTTDDRAALRKAAAELIAGLQANFASLYGWPADTTPREEG